MNVLLLLLLLLSHGDEGPGICPVGRAYLNGDRGPGIDPDGLRVTARAGSAMDPNGHEGPIIDPNG